MTTKDYIYLGLLLLTALLFYSNGFYYGVRRAGAIYGKLIDQLEKEVEGDDKFPAPPLRQGLRRYGESHESPYSNN